MKSGFAFRVLISLLEVLLSACAGATATSTPTPSIKPTAGPVDFMWSVTGDPEPLKQPSGLALDPQRNLYVVDTLNHHIRIFSPDGQPLATWGSLGSGEGQFNFQWKENLTLDEQDDVAAGVALDSRGNVYVADVGNFRVQKLDSQGHFLMQWKTVSPDPNQVSQPFDLAVDSQGNVYTIDLQSFVTKYDRRGNWVARWGGSGVGDGVFINPGYLALDQNGNVYVTDPVQPAIQKFDSNGEFLARLKVSAKGATLFGLGAMPMGIAVDEQGNIYVTDFRSNSLIILDANGQPLMEWGRQGREEGQLYGPLDVAVDSAGNIYVSETYNNRIQKFRLNK